MEDGLHVSKCLSEPGNAALDSVSSQKGHSDLAGQQGSAQFAIITLPLLKLQSCPHTEVTAKFYVKKIDFPQPIDGEEEAAKQQADVDPTKFSGKKSKAAAKQGTAATQWGILAASGIPASEIPNFR